MLLVLEYLPIVIFFIAYLLGDIFLATAALMVATLLQVVIMKLLREPVTTRHWIVMWAVLLFGGVTLFLNDDWFVKIKVTVIYIAIALFY